MQSQHNGICLVLLTVVQEVSDVDDTGQVQHWPSRDNNHLCMEVEFYNGDS